METFLKQFTDIKAVMSHRSDGSMKLLSDRDLMAKNSENRQTFLNNLAIDSNSVVSADIEHGTNATLVHTAKEKVISKSDVLVTSSRGIFLSITISDCFPLFFIEPEKGIIAIAHAGWRGIVGNIAELTVEKMQELGGSARDIHIAVGPGICKHHFEIRSDVRNFFAEYAKHVYEERGKIYVDLRGILLDQFADIGVAKENIELNENCTYEESEKYFSYRRDKNDPVEAMIAVIGIPEVHS